VERGVLGPLRRFRGNCPIGPQQELSQRGERNSPPRGLFGRIPAANKKGWTAKDTQSGKLVTGGAIRGMVQLQWFGHVSSFGVSNVSGTRKVCNFPDFRNEHRVQWPVTQVYKVKERLVPGAEGDDTGTVDPCGKEAEFTGRLSEFWS